MLRQVLNFLKAPVDRSWSYLSFSPKLQLFMILFAVNACVSILVTLLFSLLERQQVVDIQQPGLDFIVNNMPFWLLWAIVALAVPFLEELIFRLPLRYDYNPLVGLSKLVKAGQSNERKKLVSKKTHKIWERWYPWVFYFSALLFSLVHLTNFKLEGTLIALIPLLIFPYFVAGLIIGFLRVVFNFATGYLFHVVHNSFSLMLSLIVLGQPVERYSHESHDYTLIIKEAGSSFYNNKAYKFSNGEIPGRIDSIQVSNMGFQRFLSILFKKEKVLINFQNEQEALPHLNLVFFEKGRNDLAVDSIVTRGLEKAFDIKITNSIKPVKFWMVQVQDTALLSSHKITSPADNKPLTKTFWSDRVLLKNASFKDLVAFLNVEYPALFIAHTSVDGRFVIDLPRETSIERLRAVLLKEYGLKLHEKTTSKNVVNIQRIRS